MTIKIGDKIQFASKTSRGTYVSPQVCEVEDVLPAVDGVDGLYCEDYVKVKDHHGYWKESQFVLKGES